MKPVAITEKEDNISDLYIQLESKIERYEDLCGLEMSEIHSIKGTNLVTLIYVPLRQTTKGEK